DEAAGRWAIETDRGDRVSARFCVMATGCLSDAQIPPFKGIETFEGKWYHTGKWPHEGVDFTGRRVGVIGPGSSAAYTDLLISKEANDTAARFFREKIRAIVRDPAVADLLCPQSYPLG